VAAWLEGTGGKRMRLLILFGRVIVCNQARLKIGEKNYSCERYEFDGKKRRRSPTGRFFNSCSFYPCFLPLWGLLFFLRRGTCLSLIYLCILLCTCHCRRCRCGERAQLRHTAMPQSRMRGYLILKKRVWGYKSCSGGGHLSNILYSETCISPHLCSGEKQKILYPLFFKNWAPLSNKITWKFFSIFFFFNAYIHSHTIIKCGVWFDMLI